MQFATTLVIYQLGHVFAPQRSKKRLKGESSILAWFHFPNFLDYVFVIVNFCLMMEGRRFTFVYVPCHIFSFTKSRSLKIMYHVPSTEGPKKRVSLPLYGLNSWPGS